MTKHKSLKQRVRERREKTGERYTAALARVKAQRPVVPPGEEPFDATKVAKALGLTCRVSLSATLAGTQQREQKARAVLEALKALLLALDGDVGATAMAAVVLRGQPGAMETPHALAEAAATRSLLASVRAGRRGVSGNGRLAAFDVSGVTVAATLLWHPFQAGREALLYLGRLETAALENAWDGCFALAGLGGLGGER